MQTCLSGIHNIFVYMDDVILFTKTITDHERILDTVLKRFSYHGLEISLKKCQWVSSEVEYLGYVFTSEGLRPQERLLAPMLRAKLPTTLTEARSVTSLFSFYRRFIKNFSAIVHPLVKLTRGHSGKGKRVPVEADEECQAALDHLKEVI